MQHKSITRINLNITKTTAAELSLRTEKAGEAFVRERVAGPKNYRSDDAEEEFKELLQRATLMMLYFFMNFLRLKSRNGTM